MTYSYKQVEFTTKPGIDFYNITPHIKQELEQTGIQEGTATIISRHTTTAITVNEDEARLRDDIRQVRAGGEARAYQELPLQPN